VLRAGGRRRIAARAAEIREARRSPQIEAAPAVAAAYGASVRALVGLIATLNAELATLEAELAAAFARHPAAAVLESLPGLGPVLGARVLAEFGDDPTRYATPKARRPTPAPPRSPAPRGRGAPCWPASLATATSPMRVPSGRSPPSGPPPAPGSARARRSRGCTHHQALRALANRLVGILHGCLAHHDPYREAVAWRLPPQLAA
jgi:hypothetical protein